MVSAENSFGSGICVRCSGNGAHERFLIRVPGDQKGIETGDSNENSWNESLFQGIIGSTDRRRGLSTARLAMLDLVRDRLLPRTTLHEIMRGGLVWGPTSSLPVHSELKPLEDITCD